MLELSIEGFQPAWDNGLYEFASTTAQSQTVEDFLYLVFGGAATLLHLDPASHRGVFLLIQTPYRPAVGTVLRDAGHSQKIGSSF